MTRPRLRILLAFAAVTFGWLGLHAGSFPLTMENPEGAWRASLVRKPLSSPGVTLEAMVVGSSNLPRYAIMSAADIGADAASLLAFSHRLKGSLTAGQDPEAEEKTEKKMGLEGRDLRFELVENERQFACELFVFVYDKTGWGILYFDRKDAPLPQDPFLIFRPAFAAPAGVVGMTPFRVKEDPVTGFPISFSMEPNRSTGRLARITVTDVPPDSITEREGVRVGDEILTINGRKTQDFLVGTGKKSEIGLIFLNRSPGDEVTLELISPDDKKSRKVTLRIPTSSDLFPQVYRMR